jgi:hypothetical protein
MCAKLGELGRYPKYAQGRLDFEVEGPRPEAGGQHWTQFQRGSGLPASRLIANVDSAQDRRPITLLPMSGRLADAPLPQLESRRRWENREYSLVR